MIHLARKLAAADLARAPGRTAAIALLLVAAAWLPALLDADPTFGALLAVTVAFSATIGSVALDERRSRLLGDNGARPRTVSLVAAASMVVPGLLAMVLASLAGLALADDPSPASLALATVVLPVVSAPVAVRAARRGSQPLAGEAGRSLAWRVGKVVVVALLVLAVLVMPLLGVSLAALRLTSGSWSTTELRRAAGGMLALLVAGAVVFMVGECRTWQDLAIVLLWTLPALAVAVAVVGMQVAAVAAGLVGRAGPTARLALAPLAGRRRAVAPLVGLVSLVMALAVTESVVGASFGEREAGRERDLPTVTERAGNRPDQAIAVVPPVDPAALRAIAAEESSDVARAVVVEQVGLELRGGSLPFPIPFAGPISLEGTVVSIARDLDWGVDQPGGVRTTEWIGVVDPGDLAALGWSAASGPLAEGRIVRLGQDRPRGTTTLQVFGSSREHPAAGIDGPSGGVLLPGALASAETADGITALRSTARVVVVPAAAAATPPSQDDLLAVATAVGRRARALPLAVPNDLTPAERSIVDFYEATVSTAAAPNVFGGDDEVVLFESGPLNDVPGFAKTAEEGRGRLAALAALAVLMTVAAVLLALGSSRSDDVVLEVQGAPASMRSAIAAIQAAAVAGAAAAFAAVAGIGVPAVAFARYNGGERGLPDIPLVVPSAVGVALATVVVLSVAISAAVPAVRRPADPDQLAALGA